MPYVWIDLVKDRDIAVYLDWRLESRYTSGSRPYSPVGTGTGCPLDQNLERTLPESPLWPGKDHLYMELQRMAPANSKWV
jgi:hypothetical protein